ncbi:hypothetical protein N018_09680 [Pseudomonas syringae CC1557]|uniref:Uncharacterized protein n=1 Tax=Pseudomonas syringae CC1557 TaxID=1357279 RepID=W0N3B2_PSESX|nr:hypothetical protein [Pseudomonas syringae]AHG43536.1 hypothetical protein N018_09680 [Pseudomonas syringae CC1557]
MNNVEKIKEGIERRREYLRSKANVVPAPGGLQDPPLKAVELDVLDGDPEGLLHVSMLVSDLDVKIPFWGFLIPQNAYAEVTMNIRDSAGTIVYTDPRKHDGPLPQSVFPLKQNIPQASIPHEGTYTIDYSVESSSGNSNVSEPFTITIDRTAPYYNADPTVAFPAALVVPEKSITDAYFTGGVDEFVCILPEYSGRTLEDRIIVFWDPVLPENISAPDPAFGPVFVPDDLKIPIPKIIIEKRPNGPTFAVYWLIDKAGNVSSISTPAKVDVQLGALPADLKDPEVPLGPLVDLADAHLGVEVKIPAYNNPKGSTIQAKWGAIDLDSKDPGSDPVDVFISVPWSVLKSEYAGGPGGEPVKASYQVKRGSLLFPDAPLVVEVEVDFSTIGPVNPDEPNPVNPDLAPVHVVGADGEQDKLTLADKLKDITATVELYTPVAPGEVLQLYWGVPDKPVADFTVVNESAQDPITFIIPWAAIEAQGNNPALRMYYTINSATGNNPQQSLDTLVDVAVMVVGFDPVSFPDLYEDTGGFKTLSCRSLYSEDYADPTAKFGFRVQVPGDTDLNVGDTLIAVWQGYEFDTTTAIPATRFTHTHPPLTADEVANGFIFLVEPYDTYIVSAP